MTNTVTRNSKVKADTVSMNGGRNLPRAQG
jgi:hypothetical protein